MVAMRPLVLIASLSSAVAQQLTFLDPIKVGHSRWVDLGNGHPVEVRTMAMRPPLFYVSGFMSSAEADDLISEAKAGERLSSIAQESVPLGSQTFRAFDRDRNGELNERELARLMNRVLLIANHDHELFMSHHGLVHPGIDEYVFQSIDFAKYRDWIAKTYPHKMQRYSDQVWMKYDRNDTARLVRRAAQITGLPEPVVSGEPGGMQVLHYGKRGHYSCHWDTPPDHCPYGPVMRFGTMALFLHEPQAGGQIAFPAADKPGSENYNISQWASVKQQCQATERCTTMGGVVIAPKKGDAVFWYNVQTNQWRDDGKGHFMHEGKDTFLFNSLHCAAEVQAGEKWIANMWFRPPNSFPSTGSTIAAPSTIHV